MPKFLTLLTLLPLFCAGQTPNYLDYHTKIRQAEECITADQFQESLQINRQLTNSYHYVFLRDMKVAAQLPNYVKDTANLFFYLEKAMKKGWTTK